jgi:DNA repair protein RadA/Sms
MSKASPTFTCTACGDTTRKWAGKCDACGAWNSIIEEAPLSAGPKALGGKGRTIALTDLATQEPPPPAPAPA